MAQLDEHGIEFARQHITRFYDTDFFPKHIGFEAVWHNWDDVKALLISNQIREIPVSAPRAMPWPANKWGQVHIALSGSVGGNVNLPLISLA